MLALCRPVCLVLALLALAACSSSEGPSDRSDAAARCTVIAPTECAEPAPRYADVAPIFERRCASCHSGVADGPWPLDNYEHVADWALVVRDELVRCAMPPASSGLKITAEERDLILAWVRCGYAE
jgi:uncharacterized membrane protein